MPLSTPHAVIAVAAKPTCKPGAKSRVVYTRSKSRPSDEHAPSRRVVRRFEPPLNLPADAALRGRRDDPFGCATNAHQCVNTVTTKGHLERRDHIARLGQVNPRPSAANLSHERRVPRAVSQRDAQVSEAQPVMVGERRRHRAVQMNVPGRCGPNHEFLHVHIRCAHQAPALTDGDHGQPAGTPSRDRVRPLDGINSHIEFGSTAPEPLADHDAG